MTLLDYTRYFAEGDDTLDRDHALLLQRLRRRQRLRRLVEQASKQEDPESWLRAGRGFVMSDHFYPRLPVYSQDEEPLSLERLLNPDDSRDRKS